MSIKMEKIAVAMLLLFFLASGLYYAATNSITSDEKTHMATGYMNLRFNDYRFNIEHPPLVKQLAALPLLALNLNFPFDIYKVAVPADIVKIQNAFLYKLGNDLDLMLFLSRIPNILLAVLLGLFIYMYSKKLNGIFAGLISLSLFVFSPLFLGHSPLVTMDSTIGCFYFITIYFLARYFETDKDKFLFATSVCFGLSLISKFSGLLLIPTLYLLVVLRGLYPVPEHAKINFKSRILKHIIFVLFLIFTVSYKKSFRLIMPAAIVYALSYIFYKKPNIFSKINFIGRALLIIMVVGFAVVILDYTDYSWFPFHSATMPYFKGFSYFEGHAEFGQGSYLLGNNSKIGGWWYYFPFAMLVKEPFVTMLFFMLGIIGLCVKKEKILNKALLVVPAGAYLFVAMFINKLNIGTRLILPVYPFLFVIAGYSALAVGRSKVFKYILLLLILILAADVISAYPAHLSYFNRLAGGIDSGHKFLGDSNIAWGQDWKRVKEYLVKHSIEKVKLSASFIDENMRDYYKIPYEDLTKAEKIVPEEGYYLIETIAFTEKPERKIKWLDKIRPVSRIGGSVLAYHITKDDIAALSKDAGSNNK